MEARRAGKTFDKTDGLEGPVGFYWQPSINPLPLHSSGAGDAMTIGGTLKSQNKVNAGFAETRRHP